MHVFTSITANYLPKARVLATSLKRFHSNATFHLLFADSLSGVPAGDLRVFDNVVTLDELPIPQLEAWIFKHSVVELCTAIKGVGSQILLQGCGRQNLYYFDPDIAILAPLDGLEDRLADHSVVVTPHLCVPEDNARAIGDNEICALRHGIYNLGFLGIRRCAEGQRFVDWWAERLLHYCYDDIPGGLFTDQRWIDLAPAFFPDLGILHEPEYNVATWNLTHRKATGIAPYEILVEDRPLCFYHFSGFDSGAQQTMLNHYGVESPVLFDLRDWYLAECERMGQPRYEGRKWMYSVYNNGVPVTREQRLLYRVRGDLQAAFPNPFTTEDRNTSYLHWYESNVDAPARALERERAAREARFHAQEALLAAQAADLGAREAELRRQQDALAAKQAELAAIHASRSWRFARTLSAPGSG